MSLPPSLSELSTSALLTGMRKGLLFAASFCPVFIHRTVLMLQPVLLQHFQQVHWLCQHLIPPELWKNLSQDFGGVRGWWRAILNRSLSTFGHDDPRDMSHYTSLPPSLSELKHISTFKLGCAKVFFRCFFLSCVYSQNSSDAAASFAAAFPAGALALPAPYSPTLDAGVTMPFIPYQGSSHLVWPLFLFVHGLRKGDHPWPLWTISPV